MIATGLDPRREWISPCEDLTARLAFPNRITTPGDLRKVLVDLAAQARGPGRSIRIPRASMMGGSRDGGVIPGRQRRGPGTGVQP